MVKWIVMQWCWGYNEGLSKWGGIEYTRRDWVYKKGLQNQHAAQIDFSKTPKNNLVITAWCRTQHVTTAPVLMKTIIVKQNSQFDRICLKSDEMNFIRNFERENILNIDPIWPPSYLRNGKSYWGAKIQNFEFLFKFDLDRVFVFLFLLKFCDSVFHTDLTYSFCDFQH
jgi:hypothetical protein